ncbi:MAG: flavin-containing monooxygenase [Calditrichia bacterium]
MKILETLIVGAGPAGLGMAGRLRKRGLDFEMVEARDSLASSWQGHYDRLHLHTVKQLSHLPHLAFPEDYPTYVSRDQLIMYMNSYAAEFQINPRFNATVTAIGSTDSKGLRKVSLAGQDDLSAKHIIIATGVNREPNRPQWPGEKAFSGAISHSRDYKNPQPFIGKRVLVIGFGNTGAEIALDLCESGVEVAISVRSPIAIIPRDVFGRPVQLTAKKLAKIPLGIGDWLGTQIRRMIIGDLSKFGVPLSKVHPAVQLRETGKTPVIDLGTADKIKSGEILVHPDVRSFYDSGIEFADELRKDFDAVILATGYRPMLADFIPDISHSLDANGYPASPIGSGEHSGLYFVGFDGYKLGGIFGTIGDDSLAIVEQIEKSLKPISA